MNILLIFFALPVATVILAIVLQKILKNPLLVAATFLAVYLIVTFAAFDASFLVYAILYTILAYITAILTKIVSKFLCMLANQKERNCNCNITQRPITINNTCPGTAVNLSNESPVLTNNFQGRKNNCNCGCGRR